MKEEMQAAVFLLGTAEEVESLGKEWREGLSLRKLKRIESWEPKRGMILRPKSAATASLEEQLELIGQAFKKLADKNPTAKDISVGVAISTVEGGSGISLRKNFVQQCATVGGYITINVEK